MKHLLISVLAFAFICGVSFAKDVTKDIKVNETKDPKISVLAADGGMIPACEGKIAKKCKKHPKRAAKIEKKYRCAC